eukprot:373224_1
MGLNHSKSTETKSNSPQLQVTPSDASSLPSISDAKSSEKDSLTSQSSMSRSYAKEVAAYQFAVYANPRPSHEILSKLHLKVHNTQYSDDAQSPPSQMQDSYANSIAVLTTFWENNINTLSDDEYDALALTFYLNAYAAMPEAHHIFKSRLKNDASTQSKIFFGMFGWLVNEVSQPDSSHRLTRKLSVLGQLHKQMGVLLPYYLKMGDAWHQTMHDKFDKRYRLRVRFCFNTLYEIVVYIMLGMDFRSQCTQQKDKIAVFMEHINDLHKCLDDADTLEYLTLFMKQHFCDELALYYKDYKAYKCCTNQKQRDNKGKEMERLYISPSSEREINISSDRRKAFNESLRCNGYDAELFDAISDDVVTLIRMNCFGGFKQEIQRVYEETKSNKGKEEATQHSQVYSQNWNFLVNRLNQTADPDES